ncbi:MAG: VanZ family protein [Myxococcota bacterium]
MIETMTLPVTISGLLLLSVPPVLAAVGMPALAAACCGGILAGAAFVAARGIQDEERLSGRLRWLLWPQIALVVVITWMAYQQAIPTGLLNWPYSDKVMHFVMFGVVAFFAELWLDDQRWMGLPVSVTGPISLAAAEELLQTLSPARTADLVDLACDLSGMILAWGAARWILRNHR